MIYSDLLLLLQTRPWSLTFPYLPLRKLHLFISGKENTSCCTNHSRWGLTTINLLQNQSTASESSSAQYPKRCYPVIRVAILDIPHMVGLTNPALCPLFPNLICASSASHGPTTTTISTIISLLLQTSFRLQLFFLSLLNNPLNRISPGKKNVRREAGPSVT